MPAKALMFQGTSSHAGKSILASAFCRLLHRAGVRVAPFKGMNMSNNAWVTADGREMAVAQAVQARACGISPAVEMNPVLLKTASDHSSQVILLGKPIGLVRAADLAAYRQQLLQGIQGSLQKLIETYDVVVIEGAGSPAEVNLQETDLANMAVARMCGAPVVLVADIERGGVFAQLIGTLELLKPEDRNRVQGFFINKFRGDPALVASGVQWLEERTGRPVFGVLPFFQDLRIPEEDSLADRLLERGSASHADAIRIQVIRYPTISNFMDFDPLDQEPDVEVEYLTAPPGQGRPPELLILPGSKSTMADLEWLRVRRLDEYARYCLEKGSEVMGICGGFQMLGDMLYDPSHVESERSAMPGLGWLPTSTLFLTTKVTAQVSGIHLESGQPVRGYEIHAGRLQGARRGDPIFRLTERGPLSIDELDGCRVPERKVWGTYLHGIFDNPGFRRHLLKRLRPNRQPTDPLEGDPYDELADSVRSHLVMPKLMEKIPWMPPL